MTSVFLDGFEFSVKYEEESFFQREDRLGDSGERLSWEQVLSPLEELCGILGRVTEIVDRDSQHSCLQQHSALQVCWSQETDSLGFRLARQVPGGRECRRAAVMYL